LVPSGASNQTHSQNLEAKAMTDPICQKTQDTRFSCITTSAICTNYCQKHLALYYRCQASRECQVIPQTDHLIYESKGLILRIIIDADTICWNFNSQKIQFSRNERKGKERKGKEKKM
jgi:hypothetical protein